MIKILLSPLLYLKVKHTQKKYYDLFCPLIISFLFTIIMIWADPNLEKFTEPKGVINSIIGLLQMLAGFFIAALSVIATFTSPNMDKKMAGNAPTLDHSAYPGELKQLTRRRFLALMFGYLSFSTVLLYLALITFDLWANIGNRIIQPGEAFATYSSWGLLFIFSFWFVNILITTLLGLHYLSERIHREEQKSGAAKNQNPSIRQP